MSKTKKVTLAVQKWNDDPECPKCLRVDASDETAYSAFHLCRLDGVNLLLITCATCGYNWLMETADAK